MEPEAIALIKETELLLEQAASDSLLRDYNEE
jgi:hypothetical protein